MEMKMNEAGLAVLQAASTIMSGILANPANSGLQASAIIDDSVMGALDLAQRIYDHECYRAEG